MLIFSLVSIDCFSQTPLTIDDIFTANNRYRVNFGVNYFNDSDFQPLTNFRSNIDIIDKNFGLSYGYTKNIESSINLFHSYIQERLSQFGNRATNDARGTKRANFGASHKISADNNTPALIGLFRVGYLSNPTWDKVAFSGTLGLVTYRSYDPILLSVSVLAQDTQEFQVNGDNIKQGMRVSINSAISFAINSHITLTSGLKMQWQQGQKLIVVELL
ncbi:hypothetical protein [Pseudoteredinibacter isoporae]|uniref:hypothetical protein n=1 Tax=Pseudoteredinibacter isoporae TaxID=570281 RepID=UPI0031044FA5